MKPVAAAPVTVAVPGKPAIALMAAVRFSLVYGIPLPPMRAESLPPMRTRNGEKYAVDPLPEFRQLARDRVLERPSPTEPR